MKSNFTVKEQG